MGRQLTVRCMRARDEGFQMLGQHLVERLRLGRAASVGETAALGVSGWHAVAARKMETSGEFTREGRRPRRWALGSGDHTCVCPATHAAEAGTLGKALALHMAAVLPSATGHSINLDDQYEEDYTTERIPVIEGFSRVLEGPGLGFDVDEAALARLAANKPANRPDMWGFCTCLAVTCSTALPT